MTQVYLLSHRAEMSSWHLVDRSISAEQMGYLVAYCGYEIAAPELGECGWIHPKIKWVASLDRELVESVGWSLCKDCVRMEGLEEQA